MKMAISAMLLIPVLAGCSHLSWGERNKLDKAVALMERGGSPTAIKMLTEITREKPVKGVTDEALFRLSLLTLRAGSDNDTALATLLRLKKEFPFSPWTRNAVPLLEVVTEYEEVRQQNKSLRNTNQTLSKENRELLQNIERLKSLDLELERKIIGK